MNPETKTKPRPVRCSMVDLGIRVPPFEAVSALVSISRWFDSSAIGRELPLSGGRLSRHDAHGQVARADELARIVGDPDLPQVDGPS